MIDREKLIAEKKAEIIKISKEQIRLMMKASKLAAKVYKTMPAQMRNLGKVMVICFQIRGLEIQKHIIISQPIPKREFPKGAAMVGDNGKPEIIVHNGKEIKV
jgi:hypothetical protein